MAINRGMKALAQGFALMLMARGALAGGFGLGDIGKAVEAVGKDRGIEEAVKEVASGEVAVEDAVSRIANSSRTVAQAARASSDAADALGRAAAGPAGLGPQAGQALGRAAGGEVAEAVRHGAQRAAAGPERLAGDASRGAQALAGAGAPRAAGALGDAARGAPAASAAASAAVGRDAEAAAGVGERAEHGLPGAGERLRQTAQGALGTLLQGQSVEGAAAEVTSSGKAPEAIAMADLGRIEDAVLASAKKDQTIAEIVRGTGVDGIGARAGVAEPGPKLDQAVGQAAIFLEREGAIAGSVTDTRFSSLVNKTKVTGLEGFLNLASAVSPKQDTVVAKSSTWHDLVDAVSGARKGDLDSAMANSEQAVRSIASRKFLEPVGGADVDDQPRGRRVVGHSAVIMPIVLFSFFGICVMVMCQAHARSDSMSVLGDDSEEEMVELGTSARDIVSSTQSGNPAAFDQFQSRA
ncbi:unnamed protein product [Prorocentrum cordatum]|uniref:Uncharacterized protein n=1 Tax=Prorocentrum cordatum TaxID=2364126 RepID=A0ABN9R5P1_9DINO|nr:unnamed protein product [Polarella glacialis]